MMFANEVFEVPCPPFNVTLSYYDRWFIPLHSRRILCFSLPPATKPSQVAENLKKAYELTIKQLPFLAGSIVPFPAEKGGAPWLRDLVPQGTAKMIFKDLTNEVSFEHLRKMNFSQSLLVDDQLCPFDKPIYMQEEPVDVCRFQANFIDGGLLLAVCIIHTVCDGRAITEVLKVFADMLRLVENNEELKHNAEQVQNSSQLYECNRNAILDVGDLEGDITRHPGWTIKFPQPPAADSSAVFVCKTFRVSTEKLAELRGIATTSNLLESNPDQSLAEFQTHLSRHDVVLTLVWRSMLMARQKAGIADLTQQMARLSIGIDFRRHFDMTEAYFGNCVGGVYPELDFSVLANSSAESSIAHAAATIRRDVKSYSASQLRDLLAWIRRTTTQYYTRPTIFDYQSTTGIFSTSYWAFDIYGLDFGKSLGHHIESFRLPQKGVMPGWFVVLPRTPQGDCEFVLSERAETMQCMLEDEYFSRFAVECVQTS